MYTFKSTNVGIITYIYPKYRYCKKQMYNRFTDLKKRIYGSKYYTKAKLH